MADNITIKDGAGANVVMATSDRAGVNYNKIAGYDDVGDKLLIGTARERFFTSFFDFDTVNDWEVVSTGSGMTITGPLGGGAAGSTPYLNIASGVTTNSRTVILSRSSWRAPIEARVQISASQRIADNLLRVGFVEVDETTGAVLTSTTYATATSLLNARNAAILEMSGTVATTGSLLTRSGGSAVDTTAAAFGTGFTTVATGTGPNYIAATTYSIAVERDRVNARAWGMNSLANTGGQFITDRVIPNPMKSYKLAIIVDNGAVAPASTTDWRVHLVNVMDATRLDVSPRNAGTTDLGKSFPVSGTVTVGSGTVTTVSTVTAVTTSGTPLAPATPYTLNSLASTNIALILTGTSGLHAFYATNTGATAAFVKLYNKATAPVLASDVPAMIIPVPAAVSGVPGVATLPIGHNGFRFALGLGIAITGAVGDTDTTAVAAGQVKVMLSRTI